MADKKKIEYIDILRAAATVAVVFYHVEAGSQELKRIIAVLFNWCVPIFIMISGSLYLGVSEKLTLRSVSKHIFKTVFIILFWGLIYNSICLAFIEGVSGAVLPKSLYMILNADTTYCFQFWYLYLLIGLYLIIVLVHPWVAKNFGDEQCSKEGNVLMILFFLIAVLLPQILELINYSKTFWKGAFTPFTIYIYYLLCGAYIHKYGIPVIIRGLLYLSACTVLGLILVLLIQGNYERASKFYGYGTFYAWAVSSIIYNWGKNIRLSGVHKICKKCLFAIADNSLGIYILHVMVLSIIRNAGFLNRCGPVIFTILSVFISVIICVIVTKFLKRIPIVKKIV